MISYFDDRSRIELHFIELYFIDLHRRFKSICKKENRSIMCPKCIKHLIGTKHGMGTCIFLWLFTWAIHNFVACIFLFASLNLLNLGGGQLLCYSSHIWLGYFVFSIFHMFLYSFGLWGNKAPLRGRPSMVVGQKKIYIFSVQII